MKSPYTFCGVRVFVLFENIAVLFIFYYTKKSSTVWSEVPETKKLTFIE